MPKEIYAKVERRAEATSAVLVSSTGGDGCRGLPLSGAGAQLALVAQADGQVDERGAALSKTLASALWVTALLAGTLLAVSGIGKFASLPDFAVVLKEVFSLGSTLSSALSVGSSEIFVGENPLMSRVQLYSMPFSHFAGESAAR